MTSINLTLSALPQLSTNKLSYVEQIARDGFSILERVLDSETVDALLRAIPNSGNLKAFGIRNLLNVVPSTRDLANHHTCRSIVEPILGTTARVVRGIYFDKHKVANWKVAWHQDLTIAVQERFDIAGYGPWSLKAGIHHVQPPAPVLQNMLAVRIHLDDTHESNGALRVLPGTHQYGRLDAHQLDYWKERRQAVTCSVNRGGVILMRPLLLHSSMQALTPSHRRVLHFEYSPDDLPGGLKWFEEPR